MASACFDNCGNVHGFCNESAAQCECQYPWVNLGDLVPKKNLVCDVNFEVSKALWTMVVAIEGIYLMLLLISLLALRRGTKVRERLEVAVLCNLILANALHLTVGALQMTASSPGARSIGVDILTTTVHACAEFGIMTHSILLPFVHSGTSILPFALSSSPTMRRHPKEIKAMYGFFTLLLIAASLIVFAMPFAPDYIAVLISSSMALIFVLMLGSSIFVLILVDNLLRKLSLLTTTSQGRELSKTAKTGMEKTRQRSKSTKVLALVALFLYTPQFLVFAISPVAAWRAAWAWFPIKRAFVCIFDLRHIYLSLTTSCSHKNRDTEERTTKDNDGDDEEEEEEQKYGAFSKKQNAVAVLSSTGLLAAPSKKKNKQKQLTRVEEERTVDIRTEGGTDGTSF